MSSLAEDLGKSLSKNAVSVSVEFLENGIDMLISEDTLRNIPILNSIGAAIRVGRDLRERNLFKQTSAFLSEFNSGVINEEKLQKYKKKLEKDKEKTSELERVLLILNNNIDVEKSKIVAKLFTAYINERITWSDFCEYSDVTSRLFIEDLRILRALYENPNETPKIGDNFRSERLYAIGLIGIDLHIMGPDMEMMGWKGRSLNTIGKTYCNIIFNKEA